MTEFLSAQADQLNRGEQPVPDEYMDAMPGQRAELEALMQTAARTKRTLTPITMPAGFRAHLGEGLTMAARYKESQHTMLGSRESAWGWVIGAAALGSAAGLIALAWRARHPREAGDEAHIAPMTEKAAG